MSHMVFVPMTWDEAVELRSGVAADMPYRGCAATPSLVASLEADTLIEEAEYAALSYAGVLALVLKPGSPRLVVAAEVQPGQLTDFGEALGEVELRRIDLDSGASAVRRRTGRDGGGQAGERVCSRADPRSWTRRTGGRTSTRQVRPVVVRSRRARPAPSPN